jgi:hypothetical protein
MLYEFQVQYDTVQIALDAYGAVAAVTSFHPISKKLNSVALVRKRTIPTERPPFVGEVQQFYFNLLHVSVHSDHHQASTINEYMLPFY